MQRNWVKPYVFMSEFYIDYTIRITHIYTQDHTPTQLHIRIYKSTCLDFFLARLPFIDFGQSREHFKVHLYQSVNALKRARWPWPFLHPTPPAKILILTNIIDTICYAIWGCFLLSYTFILMNGFGKILKYISLYFLKGLRHDLAQNLRFYFL